MTLVAYGEKCPCDCVQSVDTANALNQPEVENDGDKEVLQAKIKTFLLEPRSFLTKQEVTSAKCCLEIDTLKIGQRQEETRQKVFPQGESTNPLTFE